MEQPSCGDYRHEDVGDTYTGTDCRARGYGRRVAFLNVAAVPLLFASLCYSISQFKYAESDMAKILVLEDDSDLAALIAQHLQAAEHDVTICDNGSLGLELGLTQPMDLLLLDLGLPELDGLDVCRRLRQRDELTPILMLTARNSEIDRVVGLELGADDYLGKPFSIRELQARVKALLRRQKLLQKAQHQTESEPDIPAGELIIYPSRHEVTLRDSLVNLTAREFDLLYFLASHAGHVFSREQLLNNIWGYTSSIFEHTVNSNINRLRNKMERDPTKPEYIMTVRGVGYKFNATKLVRNT